VLKRVSKAPFAQRWKGLKLKLLLYLENAGRFYPESVFKIGNAIAIAEGEPISNYMVIANKSLQNMKVE